MKICSLALLTLLLAATWTGSQGMSFRSSPSMCCYKGMFIHQKIPASRIKSYQNTSSLCPYKAVIVELPRGKFCVDPKRDWFQQYLKQKSITTST
ncbi:C-C motif chemokine 13 [Acanthisitta chloris]|nr:C-C motif chemokine 13 [Acanthisitta chloris]